MTQFLLAAEADKIQDLLFRSARLREVAGGSQLLTDFCAAVPPAWYARAGEGSAGFVIHAGGSFRVLFESFREAEDFGHWLAEFYARALGGTLTIAKPVSCDSSFPEAAQNAEDALRREKSSRRSWAGSPHSPYAAFCSSCGAGLAVEADSLPGETRSRDLCSSCLSKAQNRRMSQWQFLLPIARRVFGDERAEKCDWPGDRANDGTRGDATADIGRYDPRNYVAYLLADGNAMGEVFGRCASPCQMNTLSGALTRSLQEALAEPVRVMLANQPARFGQDFIPLSPLILGGDDVFALIPAPWALDIALAFCRKYEEEMAKRFRKLGAPFDALPRPTVSAAVVICKASYPYSLAHRYGETLLQQAKAVARRLKASPSREAVSVVNFDLIVGSNLVHDEPGAGGGCVPTLRPYLVAPRADEAWGLPVDRLLDQRLNLTALPRSRLHQLRSLFDDLPGASGGAEWERWCGKLEEILSRASPGQGKRLHEALEALGAQGAPHPHRLLLKRGERLSWSGLGLPDLLSVWDFAFRLAEKPEAYEGEEEEE